MGFFFFFWYCSVLGVHLQMLFASLHTPVHLSSGTHPFRLQIELMLVNGSQGINCA